MEKDPFSHSDSSNVLKDGTKSQHYIFKQHPHFLHLQIMKGKCSYSKMIHCCNLHSLFSFPTIHAKELTAPHHMESQTPEYLKLSSITDADVKNYLVAETGYMRVKEMFSKDNKGNYSPELMLIRDVTEKTFILGGIMMSVLGAKESREKHIMQTKAVVFRSKLEASRTLSDQTWIGAFKSGAKWGVRLAAFSVCFLGVSQTIAVYRNKSSPLEYTAASAVTGALMKTNLGIKGMIGGGFFGSVFGFVAGLCLYGCMIAVNQTQEQRHYEQIVRRLEMSRDPSEEIESLQRSQITNLESG